jgi:phage gp46-like protein
VPDIRLLQNTLFPGADVPHTAGHVVMDWNLLSDGSLDDTQALATAVVVALGTDALADASDILPDPDSTDRRGWWGNLDATEIWDGWDIGCKLWLLQRDKIVGPEAQQGATVTRVEYYIQAAIQPFIERRIGSRMWVKAERVAREQINAVVRLYRGPLLEIELVYQLLWSEIQATGSAWNVGILPNPESAPVPIP